MNIKHLALIISILFSLKIQAQVTANFSSNTNSGCPNSVVAIISDLSISTSGTIDDWSWTISGPSGFTDVVSSTNQVSSSLTIPGFYTVTLTACDDMGFCDTFVQTDYIEVFEMPSYTYTISPTQGCAPQEVCFDLDIDPGCGTTNTILFDVNDGVVYNVDSFCHTYSSDGNYFNFTFSTQNSCGCVLTETISDNISIAENPIANFTADQVFTCTAPLNVNFTNTSTATSNATYLWNIPGEVTNASSTDLNHNFGVGNYDVELIVTEPEGCTDTIHYVNMISVGDPVAEFDSELYEICEGESIQFNDSSLGTPSGWLWEVVGTPITSNSQNPSITFPSSGSFDIRLTTSFPGGCQDVNTKVGLITVNDSPVNSFTVSDSGSCVIPFNTIFNSTSTNSINTVWSFPGGTPSTATGNGPINVMYANYGNYNVVVSDTSIEGCYAQTIFNSVVTISELVADIVSDNTAGCMPVNASLMVTTNVVDTIITYNWNLPGSDIGTSNLANPLAVYNSNTCFDVDVIVATNLGCIDTVTRPNYICAGVPPVVDFDFTPLSTCFEVDDICFTFTGSGADTVLWNFDDGPTLWASPSSSPCHAYTSDIGEYSPTVIAFNNGCSSDTLTFTDSVSILGPIAVFTSDIASCIDWNTIEFTNSSVEADSSYWDFGDASVPVGTDTSTLTTPTWVYPVVNSIQNYSVTLVVFNFTTGCEHSVTNIVRVFPPNADFTSNLIDGCIPQVITFSNTSYDIGPSAFDTRWNYDSTYYFGTAPVSLNVVWSLSPVRQKTYSVPGVYDVIMRNNDTRGCLDTVVKSNYISIHGVFAGFTADVLEACVPFTVNFVDTSIAPLTYVDSWHWDFGTGNPEDTSNIQNPSFEYTEGGYYDVSLTVTDSFGCVETVVLSNYIYAHEPLASFSLSDNFICNNQNISITNLSVGDSLTYDWQFQNGVPAVFSPTGNPPNISFTTEGNQDIYLEVTDNIGCIDDTTFVLSVFDVIAAGSADIDYSDCSSPPLLVNFTNNSSNNVDSSSVVWDFGNGITSTDYSPSTLYASPGEYVVTLAISALTGCIDTVIIDTIVIEGPWGTFEALNSNEICVCDTVDFAIKTLNAVSPDFLTGDGRAISFNPIGLLGDTIYDTLRVEYCTLGSFSPFLSFSQGTCSYTVSSLEIDSIKVDSLVSNFSYQNIVYCDTGTVCFTDLSRNEINGPANVHSWMWDFDDGNTSILQNPCNFYNSPGVYNVCLTVSDSVGCQNTFCDSVVIRSNPLASFGMSDTSICIGNTINFYDSSILNIGSLLDSIHWDFGTGNATDTAMTANPTFTFLNAGLYNVRLEVFDNFGCHSVDSFLNEVYILPTILASVDTFVCIGDSVQLSASGANSYSWTPDVNLTDDSIINPLSYSTNDIEYFVTGIDSNGCSNLDSLDLTVSTIYADFNFSLPCASDTVFFTDLSTNINGNTNSWSWNFNDTISGVDSVSSLQNPSHVFDNSGNYNVTLSVGNDMFCFADTLIPLSVSVSPEAIFESDSVCIGLPINFSSLLSTNGSGTIIQSNWDFGTGNIADTSNLSNPSFTYLTTGLYTVCLTVTSDLNCASNSDDTCMTVQIYDLPNVFASADTFVCIGDSVQLTSSGANDYSWIPNIDLTDDSIFNPLSFSTNDIEYFVTGVDSNGCSNIDSLDITVSTVYANFDFSEPCVSDSVFFNDLSTNINGNINVWSWNFNDSISGVDSVSSLQNPVHIFNNSGNHDVFLSVENDKFCSADTVIQVSVSISPEAIFESDSVCLGLPINFSSLLSTNGSGTIVQTDWDFGTGNIADTSNLPNPSFTYSTAGLFTVCLTVTSDLNCIGNSDDTCMTVQIYNPPTTNESIDTVCLGNDNTFVDLTSAGDAAVVAEYWNFDQNIGDTLIIPGNVGNTTFGYNTFGSYDVIHIAIDANTCIDSSLVKAIVYDNPVSSYTFASNCLNSDNVFTSTSTGGIDGINAITQYSWDIDEGASFNIGANIETVDFNNLGIHNVSLSVVDAFGCTDTSTQSIDILPAPVAQIVLSDNDICVGEIVNLDGSTSTIATPGVQYAWDENYNTGIDNNVANYNFSPSSDVQVMLVVTDDNSCFDTAFANIVVHTNPIADFTNENGCIGLPLALNSTSTSSEGALTSFDWLINNTPTLTGENTSYTPLASGSFDLQLIVESAFNCIDSSVVVSVIVDTTVVINFSANDTVICAPNEIPFEVTGSADNYLWLPQNLFIDNTSENVLANIENSTTITVTGYSENNYCPEASDTLDVIVAAAPSIEYTANPNPIFVGLSSEIELDIDPFNANDSVLWENDATLNTLEGLYVEASPLEETDYEFTVVYYFDSVRCLVDSFVNIQVLDECNDDMVYAPNVFTPNSDGKNDIFGISGISVASLNFLRIYDRWGKLVYEAENVELKSGSMKKVDAWDGNNNKGNYCNNGVFVFMYEAICINGSTILGNGNVTLIR